MSSDGQPALPSWTLVALGCLALVLGVFWAVNYRGVADRHHHRLSEERARLPPPLRSLTPPPEHPLAQRVSGVLLALLGLLFAVAGAWSMR